MLNRRKRSRGPKETREETQEYSGGKPTGMQATIAYTPLNIRLKTQGPIGTLSQTIFGALIKQTFYITSLPSCYSRFFCLVHQIFTILVTLLLIARVNLVRSGRAKARLRYSIKVLKTYGSIKYFQDIFIKEYPSF